MQDSATFPSGYAIRYLEAAREFVVAQARLDGVISGLAVASNDIHRWKGRFLHKLQFDDPAPDLPPVRSNDGLYEVIEDYRKKALALREAWELVSHEYRHGLRNPGGLAESQEWTKLDFGAGSIKDVELEDES